MDRRSFLYLSGASLAACALPRPQPGLALPTRPRPTPSQLAWHNDELAMFLHFGVNTFTDREWGDGKEDPAIFNPTRLDARQWARVAKGAGFRAMILTAKHHDGFCLWPTRTTEHSVAKSPFRGGHGDVVREFVDACHAEGLEVGLYLSPWDRNNPTYGDSPRYNDLYVAQLTELLTQYGRVDEVWFDGANGEGPNGKRQVYDWPRVFALVRRLQPGAVMFSDAGPDVRWCGNESGTAGDPNWAMINPESVPYIGASGPAVISALQHGDPNGTVWRPAEVDVSIRPGWFNHPADDAKVRSVENLVELYFTSVGRNAKLLLNVPPTKDGLLHETDVARLSGFRNRLDSQFATDLAAGGAVKWIPAGATPAELTVNLRRSTPVSVVRLEERIAHGQVVSGFTLFGASDGGQWQVLTRGTTIGHARLIRFTPTSVQRVRLAIDDAVAPPEPITLRLFAP